MVSSREVLTELPAESETVIVTFHTPGAVGVPERMAVLPPLLNESPGGMADPVVTAKV